VVLPWKPGLLRGCIGPYFISATRFTYGDRNTHLRALGQSLRVRACWPYIADSVGLSAKADFRSRSLYLLSVWLAYADLQQWVRSEHHAVLVDRYRTRLTGTAYEGWTSETFDLASSWRRALERLRT
jgi:hypothetical protein